MKETPLPLKHYYLRFRQTIHYVAYQPWRSDNNLTGTDAFTRKYKIHQAKHVIMLEHKLNTESLSCIVCYTTTR